MSIFDEGHIGVSESSPHDHVRVTENISGIFSGISVAVGENNFILV